MSKIKKIFSIVLVTIGLMSCDVLQQMSQIANFAKCTFEFNSVNSVEMLGLNIRKGMTRSDLNVNQAIALTRALVNKSLPVTFNVHLDITNPNSRPASMTKILTALVAAEQIKEEDLDRTVTITVGHTDYAYSNDLSAVNFEIGEVVTVRDLFYGTILPSGADAAGRSTCCRQDAGARRRACRVARCAPTASRASCNRRARPKAPAPRRPHL